MWPYTEAESCWISDRLPRPGSYPIADLSAAEIEAYIREGQRLRSEYIRASVGNAFRSLAAALRGLGSVTDRHPPAMPTT